MKIGNIEVPDGIKLIISAPNMSEKELKELTEQTRKGGDFMITNMRLEVIAKNDYVIVLKVI